MACGAMCAIPINIFTDAAHAAKTANLWAQHAIGFSIFVTWHRISLQMTQCLQANFTGILILFGSLLFDFCVIFNFDWSCWRQSCVDAVHREWIQLLAFGIWWLCRWHQTLDARQFVIHLRSPRFFHRNWNLREFNSCSFDEQPTKPPASLIMRKAVANIEKWNNKRSVRNYVVRFFSSIHITTATSPLIIGCRLSGEGQVEMVISDANLCIEN